MAKNDGGAAFPTEYHRGDRTGMSLRDWFAGQALNGMIASGTFIDPEGLWTGNGSEPTAEGAYLLADAMLAEREKDNV